MLARRRECHENGVDEEGRNELEAVLADQDLEIRPRIAVAADVPVPRRIDLFR